jgi:hypothetical protein
MGTTFSGDAKAYTLPSVIVDSTKENGKWNAPPGPLSLANTKLVREKADEPVKESTAPEVKGDAPKDQLYPKTPSTDLVISHGYVGPIGVGTAPAKPPSSGTDEPT